MNLTKNEKRTVVAVFGELLQMGTSKLNTFLGSITIQEMQTLYMKLSYEDYCEKYHIKYEDMTVEDFEDAYRERWES